MIAIKRRLFTQDRIYRALHQLTTTSVCHSHSYCVEELGERGVVEVTGADASSYLQGLITNDIRHLDHNGAKSMFTMFLNSKGCVLYDSIIHKVLDKFYVECDVAGVASLEKHLKMFKVRRKVDINVADSLKVWSVFDPMHLRELKLKDGLKIVKDVGQETVVPCQGANVDQVLELDVQLVNDLTNNCLTMSNDPRLPSLGLRVIASDHVNVTNIMKDYNPIDETISYKLFRYMLGVGEGMSELPHGECFPLEVNCDYLHGVSFHKGCYIGQELTARIHHTGVVRKRLMPIYLDVSNCEVPFNTPIYVGASGKQKKIGKLRGVQGNTALGLIRISDALGAERLKIGDVTGYTLKPHWWPQEASKEKQMSTRE